MNIELNPDLTGYELAVQLPCNPANIAGETYDFEELTAEQADKLISLGSPYVVKKTVETMTEKVVETPVLVAVTPVVAAAVIPANSEKSAK